MKQQPSISIKVNPVLSADELFAFYKRNDICEVGFGKEMATRILQYPHLRVGAFAEGELVGLARATFDGLSAHIMEFSVDVRHQGDNTKYGNGSLIEADRGGVGQQLGRVLLDELKQIGATFITGYIVANCEEPFYKSLGFSENEGHLVYYIDERPYIAEN